MHGVGFERGTVAEGSDEACVVGAREFQQIAADAETHNLRDDGNQTLEPRDVPSVAGGARKLVESV